MKCPLPCRGKKAMPMRSSLPIVIVSDGFPKGCIDINMLDIRQSFDIFQSGSADRRQFLL